MKIKLTFILVFLFILVFPIIIGLCIILSSSVLKCLDISPIVFFDYPFQMSISEYTSVIISLLSCFSSAFIAFLALKLSKTIENRNQTQEINKKKAILEIILCQIKYDKRIIETYHKKTVNNLDFLVLLDLSQLLEVRDLFNKETLDQVLDVSAFINLLKHNKSNDLQNITDYNKHFQNTEKIIVQIEEIIEELE